jgi:hypothetical protein
MERIFQIAAAVFALAAVYFWWTENADWAFAMGVLAASSFFINIRIAARTRITAREAQKASAADPEEPTDKS